jgi:hypothetical protein
MPFLDFKQSRLTPPRADKPATGGQAGEGSPYQGRAIPAFGRGGILAELDGVVFQERLQNNLNQLL